MAYVGPNAPPSPTTVTRWRADLAAFRAAYITYINQTLPVINQGGAVSYDGQRQAVVHLAAVASRAMVRSGITPIVCPPPVAGGAVLRGLSAVAFAHEDQRYRAPTYILGPPPKTSPELTVESVDLADANLALLEADARKRYRSPLFWADRVLRAVLGLPAYLLSVLLGFDPADLSTRFQRVLWLLSVAADLAALYGLVKALNL